MSRPPACVLVGPDRRHGRRPLGLPRLVVPVQLPWLVRLPSARVAALVRMLVGVPRRPIGPADSRRPSFDLPPSWGMLPSPTTELLIHRPAMKPPQPDLNRWLRGRLKFEGARHPAPFPSAVVVFRPPLPVVTSVSVKPGRPSA
jgi:hypothetical protein